MLQGRVVNATPGGGDVAGLVVTLHQVDPGGHRDFEAVTDEDGRFRFEGVTVGPGVSYGVSVKYQGALYGQDLDLSSGAPPSLTLTVYEATDDEDVLSTVGVSVLFSGVDEATQNLGVLEIVAVQNTSDRTYVPGPDPMKLLRFSLPPGAHDLAVETSLLGADLIQVKRGFALTASVPPGEHDIMYAYQLPYSGSEVSFAKSLPYGAGRVRLLAPEGAMRLTSPQLGVSEAIDIGGQTYLLLEGKDLPRGADVTVMVSGLPQASLANRLGQGLKGARWEYAAPAGFGALALLVLGFALWRRGQRRPVAPAGAEASMAESEHKALVRRLADLRRSFESGALSDEEYQRQRGELMARLLSLLGSEPTREAASPRAEE